MAQIIIKGLIGEEDIQKYDGTATTFTRANSTGGTSTLTPVGAGSSGLKFTKLLVSSVVTLSANPAAAGVLRLAYNDLIAWRRFANDGDIYLVPDSSNRLTFNGNSVSAPLYNAAGTIQQNAHIVQDTVTLSGGTATVTLTGSAVFTNATSYTCIAMDDTGANAVKVTQTSGSSITFTGTGSDVIRYICIGT